MRRFTIRETTLAHLATAAAVVLLAVAMAASPLGREFRSAQMSDVEVEQASEEESPAPELAEQQATVDQSGAEEQLPALPDDLPSARGGWPIEDASQAPPSIQSTTSTPSMPEPPPPPKPPGPRPRVGIQAGHWKNSELPAELAGLRGSTGARGQGWAEVDVNLDIARRVIALLEERDVQADLIPATVPSRYKADAFVAIHCDANGNTRLSGYKLARARWSSIPEKDDDLLRALSEEYRAGTRLPEHPSTITMAMRAYYAFDNRRLEHAVAPTTPAVILETSFLTNPNDLKLMREQPDLVAEAIAMGILRFLGE